MFSRILGLRPIIPLATKRCKLFESFIIQRDCKKAETKYQVFIEIT